MERYILVLFQDGGFAPSRRQHIGSALVAELRVKIEEMITAPPEQVEIDVWLESPGGLADSAYKLAVLLRAYSSRLRVVVPDYAKSAATLLAIAADEIYMAPAAELGPLDAQVPNPDEGGLISRLSALDLARSLDDLTNLAMERAFEGGADVLQITRLSRADSLSAMLDFTAKFMAPIIGKFDPKMIHWANSLLAVSVAYAERLLALRQATDHHPEVADLPRQLAEDYPIHSFVISRDEAKEKLHLPVFPLVDYDLAKEVTVFHRAYEEGRANLVRLMRPTDLLDVGVQHEDGGEQGAREGREQRRGSAEGAQGVGEPAPESEL